jgi:hypothetical protein
MRSRKGLKSSGGTKKTSTSISLTNLVQLTRHQQQIVLSSVEHSASITQLCLVLYNQTHPSFINHPTPLVQPHMEFDAGARRLLFVHFVSFFNLGQLHLRVDALLVTFVHILEGILLLWELFTTRWVRFYERQQWQDQARCEVRIPSVKKLIFILFLHFCLFLLLLLEIF